MSLPLQLFGPQNDNVDLNMNPNDSETEDLVSVSVEEDIIPLYNGSVNYGKRKRTDRYMYKI